VSAALLACTAAACGLADYPFVAPPIVVPQDPLSARFSFENNSANNPEYFEGFDIYYRFYLDSEQDDFEADRGEIQSESEAFVDAQRLLERFEYRRMHGHPSETPGNTISQEPLLSVAEAAKKESFSVLVDFEPLQQLGADQSPTLSYTNSAQTATIVPLRKPSAASDVEGFDRDVFSTDDADMPEGYRQDQPTGFILSLFVVSYGRQDLVVGLYSRPVFLGSTEFFVP
jgi:hypothetical protein